MQALILCGGKGTRLASLYSDIPKILVPIAGRPFIEWQLEWLGELGLTDIHLAGGYKVEVLEQWLKERSQKSEVRSQKSEAHGIGIQNSESRNTHLTPHTSHLTPHSSPFTLHLSRFTFHISLSAEPKPLGTGGGMRYVIPWLTGNHFLAINGDSITPQLDLNKLVSVHQQSDAAIAIAVSRIEEAGRYGTVEFDDHGYITAFREKMDRSNGWINAGVYSVNQASLETLAPGRPISLETELFPQLVERRKLIAIQCPPPMLDMGTPEGIRALEAWANHKT